MKQSFLHGVKSVLACFCLAFLFYAKPLRAQEDGMILTNDGYAIATKSSFIIAFNNSTGQQRVISWLLRLGMPGKSFK